MKTFVLKFKGKVYGYYFGDDREHAAACARLIYPWAKLYHLSAVVYKR